MTDLSRLSASRRLDFGLQCVDKGDLDTALVLFDSVLDVDPSNLHALCNGAFIFIKRRDFAGARSRIDRALMIDGQHAHAWSLRATIAQETGQWSIARKYFERAIELDSLNITTIGNLAYFSQLVGDYDNAIKYYTKARDLNPLDLNVRFNRAMSMMTVAKTQQQWNEALSEYEIRHALYRTQLGQMTRPMYTGTEPRAYKRLVVVFEQGIGDAVMMARYIPLLTQSAANGFAKVYLLCSKDAASLMGRMNGVSACDIFTNSAELPEHDYYLNSMSLLAATGHPTVQPSNAAYLRPIEMLDMCDPMRSSAPKIGLCWFGNPAHGNDRFRSIPVGKFEQVLVENSCVEYYSLHYHNKGTAFKPGILKACDVSSLDKLQAAIQRMDLIVTVDTAQLHIAGAMGKPTLMLTSRGVDWRWGIHGERTHDWYPTVKHFRSDMPLEWGTTIEKVRYAIQVFINTWQKERTAV